MQWQCHAQASSKCSQRCCSCAAQGAGLDGAVQGLPCCRQDLEHPDSMASMHQLGRNIIGGQQSSYVSVKLRHEFHFSGCSQELVYRHPYILETFPKSILTA